MNIILYIVAIILANVVTASFTPLSFGVFIVPWGTLLIGLTFMLRDFVQREYGRKMTYQVIGLALVLSALSSWLLGDTLWIVFASAISFIASETTDTEIFTRMTSSFSARVLTSGLVSGLLDSTIFVIVGLSPIGTGFVPWEFVPMAVAGQVIVKSVLQGIGALVINKLKI
ncbi:hypothetical protein A616_16745 [Brevibacillus brevis X23]|nr:hypothetical protein A616_16745 [Brevibacillus brevis X23]